MVMVSLGWVGPEPVSVLGREVTASRSLLPHLGQAFTHPSEAMNSIQPRQQRGPRPRHDPQQRSCPMNSAEAAQARDLSVPGRVDEVCNRFEAAWRAGVPALEDFLAGWHGDERLALLRELVLLDVDYRGARGEEVSRQQYACRFPELPPAALNQT